jgi:phenylacetate-CoA ligase
VLKTFDLTLILNGFPLNGAKEHLAGILAIPEQEYEAYINRIKNEIAAYHFRHNPFYQKIVGTTMPAQWDDLPVLKKTDFQRPLAERLSKDFTAGNVFINKTSGSGGEPMTFAKDRFCHALIWANIIRRFGWYGIDFNHSLQARFYGRSLDFISNVKLRIKDILSHRHRFDIFDLSDDGLQKIVAEFGRKKFDYINGYTSCIVLLAKYLRKHNIILTDICPTLKVCIVTSEMLFDQDVELLVKYLGVPVVNEYGASELEVIAFENPLSEWTVNAETLFVEILDEQNKPVANGTEGKIVVTSLFNKAHPFIRYEVGDYGILDESSTAKKPILKSLTGRTNDVAILPSGKKAPGMTFYSITKKLFNDDGNVKEFVITQTKTDTFNIEYTSDKELTPAEISKMKSIMETYLEPDLQFIFLRKKQLNRSKSGKLKQFVSLVKQ